jgi:hypothetical protein
MPNLIILTPMAMATREVTRKIGLTTNLRGSGAVDENSHFLLFWHSFRTGNTSKTTIKAISNATPTVEKTAPDFIIVCNLKYILKLSYGSICSLL